METLAPRMQEAAEKLGALLRAGLADALRAGNAPARQHCLQAFAAVGDCAGAEQACFGYTFLPMQGSRVTCKHYAQCYRSIALRTLLF